MTSTLSSFAASVLQRYAAAVNGHKSSGIELIASMARSARQATAGFQQQSPEIARLVTQTAEKVEIAAARLGEQDLGELVSAVSDFAKRRPKLFVGGGILAGFIAARLLAAECSPNPPNSHGGQ